MRKRRRKKEDENKEKKPLLQHIGGRGRGQKKTNSLIVGVQGENPVRHLLKEKKK